MWTSHKRFIPTIVSAIVCTRRLILTRSWSYSPRISYLLSYGRGGSSRSRPCQQSIFCHPSYFGISKCSSVGSSLKVYPVMWFFLSQVPLTSRSQYKRGHLFTSASIDDLSQLDILTSCTFLQVAETFECRVDANSITTVNSGHGRTLKTAIISSLMQEIDQPSQRFFVFKLSNGFPVWIVISISKFSNSEIPCS